jgi:hypothetical protein
MKGVLERDLRRLRSDGYRVLRPVIIFAASGPPVDDWQPSLEELRGSSGEAPEIFLCSSGLRTTGPIDAAPDPRLHVSLNSPSSILMSYADLFANSDVIRLPRDNWPKPAGVADTDPTGFPPIQLEYLDPGDSPDT